MSLGEYIKTPTTVGLWHLNGNANDESGNDLNGTKVGALTYSKQNGRYNEGIGQIGFTNSGIIINDNSLLDLTTFTISAWFKVNSVWDGAIVAKFKGATANVNYYIDTAGGSQKLRVLYSTGTQSTLIVNKSLLSNIWYNVIVTAGSGSIKAYIDGRLISQAMYSGTLSTNTHPLVIGARKSADGGPSTYDSGLDGCVDEVILENVIWSSVQIQKYYTNSLGRFASL